jgi:hypothetical protein
LYALSNIIRDIKSKIMGWEGHVAQMAEVRISYNILVGKPEEERSLGRPRSIWGLILKWTLGK